MRIPFRQGIVQYQQPSFLAVGFPYVDLIINGPLLITFADGTKDYLFVEQENVIAAWGPTYLGEDQWLYWEIDRKSGQRSFGLTRYEPVAQAMPPENPAHDQHWFDTTTNQMKVWNTTGLRWLEKIRVFACLLSNGSVPISVSINSPVSFDGTQVGAVVPTFAGQILFNSNTGLPLKTPDGKFATTEDQLVVKTIATSDIKFASLVVSAEAQQNMDAFTIVKFTDFGRIEHADEFTSQQIGQFGIIQKSVLVGDFANVTCEGALTNPAWDWSTVNAYLYADDAGQLTDVPPIPLAVPVATVIDRKMIVFGSPKNTYTVNNIISPPTPPATELDQGTVRLNIPATDPSDPVAIGDNDPRLTNPRTPLPHTHPQSDIIDLVADLDDRVLVGGDTMTGFLTLSGAPVDPLHAATKDYVDDLFADASTVFAPIVHVHMISDVTNLQTTLNTKVEKAGDTMSGFLTLHANPTSPFHAATKQYVDGGLSVPVATNVVLGRSRLSLAALDPLDPIVVGNNDPRLTDSRNPLSHTHPQSDIDDLIQDLDDKVFVSGDAMTGFLTLHADPTSPMHAATKQYVDDNIGGGSGSVTSVDITAPLAGITATGGPITSTGSITLALANDLLALENLGATGFAVRTGVDTWAQRSILGTTNVINVSNGDGIASHPTITIATDPVLTGSISSTHGDFAVTGDAIAKTYVLRNTTASASPTQLFLNGATTQMILQSDSTWSFDVNVVARRTDTNNESASYRLSGTVDRNAAANTVALIGPALKTIVGEDVAGWDVDVGVDTLTGALTITVTGEAAKTIRWVAFVRTVEVIG